jgi:hypothetical protein
LTAKYSGLENLWANRAAAPESSVINSTPNRAPNPAERKAYDNASVARPCLAIGWPSNVVATDDGSPGMLKRIEVVEPPKSAPQYMLASRMIAETGSMANVRGMSKVTPFGAPRPGNTPTRMPNSTPATRSAR